MTQEERIHCQEINATHKQAARTQRALCFVGPAIDELEVFPSTSPPSQLPPMEEMCHVCQAVKWKN